MKTIVTILFALLLVMFQSVSLDETVTIWSGVPTFMAREVIVKVASVPLPINPIVQIPVVSLKVPLCVVELIKSKYSDGNKSFKVTLVALVPFPAL